MTAGPKPKQMGRWRAPPHTTGPSGTGTQHGGPPSALLGQPAGPVASVTVAVWLWPYWSVQVTLTLSPGW